MVKIINNPTTILIRNIKNIDVHNMLYWGDLNGKTWLRWSISLWDIIKTDSERKLNHPAIFPLTLSTRLIRLYSRIGDVVLDPFMGTGTTLVAAMSLLRKGIGFEIYDQYIKIAVKRLLYAKTKALCNFRRILKSSIENINNTLDFEPIIIRDDARKMDLYLSPNTVDLVLTSPPYFDIQKRKRTSDRKKERPYGKDPRDLGNIDDYETFLTELTKCFSKIYRILKSGGVCIIIVMDLRKGAMFYPFHVDVTNFMRRVGFKLRDIIIWDRRKEYNNLKPIGYPHRFIVNKVHEYILIFEK